MANVISMVVKLDNGTYRTIKLHKVKSIYTAKEYLCNGTIQEGEDDVAGPPTEKPVFDDGENGQTRVDGGDEEDGGNGQPPFCYWVDGMLICL
jgi:hypothetical protein